MSGSAMGERTALVEEVARASLAYDVASAAARAAHERVTACADALSAAHLRLGHFDGAAIAERVAALRAEQEKPEGTP